MTKVRNVANQKIRRGSSAFRPRARIIRTLGHDLITNEVVALQELVKNAYDADARTVTITFHGPLEPGKGAIEVADDGEGMTLQTIRTAWMEPATSSKVQNKHTRKGRRVTGEKGVGRFAAARVATVLDLVTRARGGNTEVHVRFDWGRFDNEALFLDEIKCRWEERPRPKGSKPGTALRLLNLNDSWREDKEHRSFSLLRAELSRLVSPAESPDEFRIELRLPEEFSAFGGLVTPPAILGQPHYRLYGNVDHNGIITATYAESEKRVGAKLSREKPLLDDGKKPKITISGARKPSCGPFEFEFRVWDREQKDLQPLADALESTVRDLRRDLNAACGISIYRDRFRVLLPENEDWLRLDLRRVQNPTMRISNNQIVGMVSISADNNPGLRDQTNRQGIVDSPAFNDFKQSLLFVLSKLETNRDSTRRKQKPAKSESGLFEQLDFAPVASYVRERYPDDKELRAFVERKSRSFEQGVAEVQKVVARYRRLATLGQLIDVILHEGRTPVATIANEVVLLRRDANSLTGDALLERIPLRLDTVSKQTKLLSTLFNRLSPFSGRKRGRPARIRFDQIIRDTFALHEKRIRDLKVDVRLPQAEFELTVDEAEMQMIFVNLLDNALYWLERVDEDKRRIEVTVTRSERELLVTFSDSGPGVPEDVRNRIFDPYFSTKPDGIGLGLTIAGETAAEYDGALELMSDGLLSGATFRVTLRKRIGEADA